MLLNAGTTSALDTNQAAMQIFSQGAVDVTSGTVRTTQNSDGISIASGTSVVVRSTRVTNEGTNSGYGIVLGANRGGGGFNSGVDGFAYTSASVTSGTVSTAGAGAYGIYATPNGAGTTAITSGTLTTTGANATGILVGTIGNGTSSGAIAIASDVLTTSGATSGGIRVANNTGAVAITSNRLTATGVGIDAGAAAATVTSTDLTAVGTGILAFGTGAKTVTSGAIATSSAGSTAINAQSTDGGATTVRSTTINGVGTGISASGGDVLVDSGAMTLSTTTTTNPNSLGGFGISAISSGTTATTLRINSGSIVYTGTGNTTVQAGSIRLTTPVAANTEIDLEGSGQLDLSNTTQRIAELAGASSTATLNIAGGSLTDVQNTNTTFAGSIIGNGSFTKAGTGVLNFTGTNTYTGSTTVSGGTLAVNGSIVSPVTVTAGGTLGGTGSVGTTVIASGGTYAPGNSIGTQKVNGNVTFAVGSTFAVEANAAGQADRVNATGTATLQGGIVAVAPAAGTYANLTNYTILTAAGGVSGTFAAAASTDTTLSPFLSYGANAVTLTLARNNGKFAGMSTVGNQVATGTAIAQLGVNSTIYRGLLPLSAINAAVALGNLSGEIYASLPAVLADGSKQVREAVLARAASPGEGIGVWATGSRTLAGSRDQTGIAPVITNRWSAIGGVDFTLAGARIGVDGGYIEDRTQVRRFGSTAHTDTYVIGGHVGFVRGPISVVAGGDYAWHDITAARTLGVAGFATGTAANSKAHTVQGYGEVGYGAVAGAFTVLPYARFSYVHLVSDALTESGGLGALTAGRDTRDYKFGTFGVRFSGEAPIGGSLTFLPRFSASYTHGWDVGGSRTLAFAGTTAPFTLTGTALGRDAFDVDGGFDIAVSQRFTIGMGGFASTSREWSDYGGKASIGLKF